MKSRYDFNTVQDCFPVVSASYVQTAGRLNAMAENQLINTMKNRSLINALTTEEL